MMRGTLAAVLVSLMLFPTLMVYDVSAEKSQPTEVDASGSVMPIQGTLFSTTARDAPTTLSYGSFNGDPMLFRDAAWVPRAGEPVLLQFDHVDGFRQEAMASEHGFVLLHRVSASVLLVRGGDHVDTTGVRWIGPLLPSWRLHPDLTEEVNDGLSVVPADDLTSGDLTALTLDAIEAGATSSWCGVGTCVFETKHMQPTTFARFVDALASDDRVLWIEPSYGMEVHNAIAAGYAGVASMRLNASFTLDGSGETVAVFDTGLDIDHPDLGSPSRVASVRTTFGLDPSPADSNEGHGTHVVLTVLGDGSGDSNAEGVAPAASLVMYPLEHDPTGVFGRQGSLYEMLSDADQATARIAVNAWGLNGGHGDYTSDSRSVDQYVDTWEVLLPIFSAGNAGSTGVTPPATAKNGLAIATSNGSSLDPWSSSGQGPTNDGRIKPDLMAPGIGLCSGRAEEARFPAGADCASGTHAGGDSLYMTLGGSSQATAVAGGSAALVREWIREQGGIPSPSAALIKAVMINGATDIGTPDIPNGVEGWGHLDLERTLLPSSGGTSLTTYIDDGPSLRSGNGLVYAFDLDPAAGIDITLVWSDAPGSASSGAVTTRLVNDLDVVLTSPDGTRWLGNNFASGLSTTGGSADDVNNVERIRIPSGLLTGTGQWTVEVHHRGGSSQNFGLVVVADATATPTADLVGVGNSILLSTSNPLKNDVVSITIAWMNQGTADAPAQTVRLTDTTVGQVLYEGVRDALAAGRIDSHILIHQFATTGTHSLELALDVNNDVAELNDASTGQDNNVVLLDVEVSALGLRVLPFADDGSLPSDAVSLADAALHHMDVRNSTSATIPLRVQHEGTGNQSVRLEVTQVQEVDASMPGVLLSPKDEWSRSFDASVPFLLKEQGQTGDHLDLNLSLTDLSASIGGDDQDRFAASGTFVVDVRASYANQPFVSHTQRITLVVGRVDDVLVGISGTLMPDGSPLAAVPGGSASFSIAVMNTGNAPASFNLACEVDLDGWQVGLDGTDASTVDFEPLDILDDLPMPVTVTVPPIVDGSPDPSVEAEVSCTVTSATDSDFRHLELVPVGVLAAPSFKVELIESGEHLGPAPVSAPAVVNVDSGEFVNISAEVSNTGNVPVGLTLKMQPSSDRWAWDANHDGTPLLGAAAASITIELQPGEQTVVTYRIVVSPAAVEGDTNTYTLRTERSAQNFVSNTTRLTVADELAFDLEAPANAMVGLTGDFAFLDVQIVNTGNTILILNWTTGLLPDGWSIGFSNPPEVIAPRAAKVARLGLIPPAGTPAAEAAVEVLVDVSARSGERWLNETIRFDVGVLPSMHATIDTGIEGALLDLARGEPHVFEMRVTNAGNLPLNGGCEGAVVDADGVLQTGWEVTCSPDFSDSGLAVGGTSTLLVTLTPNDEASAVRSPLKVMVVDADGTMVGLATVTVSAAPLDAAGGLFNVLPAWASAVVILVIVSAIVLGGRRLRSSGAVFDAGEELLAPGAHAGADDDGLRRAEVLQTGSEHGLTSGAVSDEELRAALAQSIEPLGSPTVAPPIGRPPMQAPPAGLPPLGRPPVGLPPAGLPPSALPPLGHPPAADKHVPTLPSSNGPPLPPGGLPEGWTVEQWQHYGQQWLDRQG